MDRRNQKRYRQLVAEHMHSATQAANGLSALPGTGKAFAATQAMYRFCNNPRITPQQLVEPLQKFGRQMAAMSHSKYLLSAHDWSTLSYGTHTSKKDRRKLTHKKDIGYELSNALLIDAANGNPLAPMEMRLLTAKDVYSTRQPAPKSSARRLDEILPTMTACREEWGLDRPVVHVIDREADSAWHYRAWDAAGHLFLVRADNQPRLRWGDRSMTPVEIAAELTASNAFRHTREASYKGRPAQQWVAEAAVILARPAKRKRNGKSVAIPGSALALRLVVSRLIDADGTVLAEWYLLTNVTDAPAATIALWYYWRWRIESYFKLLKSAGQQLEHWQQESGSAIFKRLLVAAMACVVVWMLERDQSAPAATLRLLLIRLSGRQMKRQRPWTEPALLAGLWVLLSMLKLLQHYDLDKLRALVQKAIPFFDTS